MDGLCGQDLCYFLGLCALPRRFLFAGICESQDPCPSEFLTGHLPRHSQLQKVRAPGEVVPARESVRST